MGSFRGFTVPVFHNIVFHISGSNTPQEEPQKWLSPSAYSRTHALLFIRAYIYYSHTDTHLQSGLADGRDPRTCLQDGIASGDVGLMGQEDIRS